MDSSKVVVSALLGTEGYKQLLAHADQATKHAHKDVRAIANCPDAQLAAWSMEMWACQVCHSARLPVLTAPLLDQQGLARQQLATVDLDSAPEIVLINTPGANLAYGQGFKAAFIKDGQLDTAAFETFIESLWRNVVASAMAQGATDLSLLPIGLGVFLADLSPALTTAVQQAYLTALRKVLDTPQVQAYFKNGVFFSHGQINRLMAQDMFAKCACQVHLHSKDALNLAQLISEEAGRCCALLNPSDGDVMYGLYNVGEYWQTSKKGSASHVGEEFLMHVIPGQLTGRDMHPAAFDKPVLATDIFKEKFQ